VFHLGKLDLALLVTPAGQTSIRRFYGSTGQATKKAANELGKRIRELAAKGWLTSDMTVNTACWRYWQEIGRACDAEKEDRRQDGDDCHNQLVSNDTVNRTLTEPLRTVLRRAKKAWKVPIHLDTFEWSELRYGESEISRSHHLNQSEKGLENNGLRENAGNGIDAPKTGALPACATPRTRTHTYIRCETLRLDYTEPGGRAIATALRLMRI